MITSPKRWLWFIQYSIGIFAAINPLENEIYRHNIKITHHPYPKSPASVLPDEIDLLKLMNISSKDPGVSIIEGPINKYPAYKFRLPYNNIPLSNASSVTQALKSQGGFTVVFLIRQQKNNLGTLVSVNSPGRLTPWFQMTSNLKTGILTVKYRVKEGKKLRQIDWALPKHHKKTPMAAWTWLSVTFDYKNDIIRFDLDCSPSNFESISTGKKPERIEIPEETLIYLGQEPGRKKKFLGSMQVAKVLPHVRQQRLWSCFQIAQNLAPELRKPIS